MIKKTLALSFLLTLSSVAFAQSQGDMPPPDEPDAPWVESDAPPPPEFGVDKLIPVYVGPSSSLKYGIDPKTVSISPTDNLVRYVIVAQSSNGTLNVRYEAIRCATNEIKTYAYTNAVGGEWTKQDDAQWRDIYGRLSASYAQSLITGGMCIGKNVNGPVRHMTDAIKRGGIPANPNQY